MAARRGEKTHVQRTFEERGEILAKLSSAERNVKHIQALVASPSTTLPLKQHYQGLLVVATQVLEYALSQLQQHVDVYGLMEEEFARLRDEFNRRAAQRGRFMDSNPQTGAVGGVGGGGAHVPPPVVASGSAAVSGPVVSPTPAPTSGPVPTDSVRSATDDRSGSHNDGNVAPPSFLSRPGTGKAASYQTTPFASHSNKNVLLNRVNGLFMDVLSPTTVKNKNGQIIRRCKFRHKGCNWSVKITPDGLAFESAMPHTNHPDENTSRGLPTSHRNLLKQLVEKNPGYGPRLLRHAVMKYPTVWTYKGVDWKKKIKAWYVAYKAWKKKFLLQNSIESLKTWMEAHQRPTDDDCEDDNENDHKVFTITPTGKGYTSTEQGLHIVLTTRHLIKRLATYKTVLVDATYKLSANGLLMMVLGVQDLWGRFHACAFCFTKRERHTEYGKLFQECNAYLTKHLNVNFTPHFVVHDNDDAIYKAVLESVPHWKPLVESDRLNDVNCAIHMDRGHSDGKGREKFDGWGAKSIQRLTVAQLKDKLEAQGLPIKGKKQDLVDRILNTLDDDEKKELLGDHPKGGLYDLHHKDFMRDLHRIGWEIQRPSQLDAAFKLFCARWDPIIPQLMKNFKDRYWGQRRGWWPRCLNDLNNNNPIENFNKIIKEWREHFALVWNILLDYYTEDIHAYSREDATTPDPLHPYDMPVDDVYTRTRVKALWTATCTQYEAIIGRSFVSKLDPDCILVLNPTYAHVLKTEQEREQFEFVYRRAEALPGETFEQFVARRTCFYQVRVDKMDPFKTNCSCPYWMERKTCKHALVHALKAGGSIPEGCDFRQVVSRKRKAGRPAKHRPALEKDQLVPELVPVVPCNRKEYREAILEDNEARLLLGVSPAQIPVSSLVATSCAQAQAAAGLLADPVETETTPTKRQRKTIAAARIVQLQAQLTATYAIMQQ